MRRAGRALVALPALAVLAAAAMAASQDPDLAAANPAMHERAGIALARSGGAPQEALSQLRQAVALRPVSPYAWSAYAEGRYRAGLQDATFEAALRHAVALGPNEPAVQESVAFYGLAVWEEAAPDPRAAVEPALAAGMRRDPATLMRIAERRGRLAIACRLVAPASPAADRIGTTCKGSEAR
jgi:hypothetical protein